VKPVRQANPARAILVDESLDLFGTEFNIRILRFFSRPGDVPSGNK